MHERPRDVSVAFLLSLLIHFLLVLLIAFFIAFEIPAPEPEDEMIELTILPPPEEETPPSEPRYAPTSPDQAVDVAPENPLFESDNNTVATSEEAPQDSSSPLPSVDGEEMSVMDFWTQMQNVGEKLSSTLSPEPSPPATPEPQTSPTQKPTPTPEPILDALVLKPKTPKEKPTPRPVKKAEPVSPPAENQAADSASYQPLRRVTRIRGGISTRGRASVAAASTPLGKFKKQLSDAIGSRWYYYVQNEIGLFNIGTVVIRFTVYADGTVKGVKVLTNTSNESFATCSIRAIIDAEIPPIPAELSAVLEGERIEVDYTFTILSN